MVLGFVLSNYLGPMLTKVLLFCIAGALMLGASTSATPICKTTDPQVLILGGGMSGVAAARRLYDAGVTDFVILEARDKSGGRFIAEDFFGEKDKIRAAVIRGVDLDNTGKFKTNPLWTLALDCGIHTTVISTSYDFYDASGTIVASSLDPAFINLTNRFYEALTKAKILLEKLSPEDYKDISIRAALNMSGWFPVTQLEKFVDWYNLEYSSLLPPEQVSAFGIFHDHTFADFGPYKLLINDTRGAAYLIQCIGEPFLKSQSVHLNTLVNSVEHGTECVCADVMENGNQASYCGKFAIVTFSAGVFQSGSVLYNPPLPQWKLDAYNSFSYAEKFITYIHFDQVFWDPSTTSVFPRSNYSAEVTFAPGPGYSNFMAMSIFGPNETVIASEYPEDIKRFAYEWLRKVYGANFTANITNIDIPNTFKFQELGVLVALPGTTQGTFYNVTIPLGNLYFAGDICSEYYYRFAHGAYLSGNATANALLDRMSGGGAMSNSNERAYVISFLAVLFCASL